MSDKVQLNDQLCQTLSAVPEKFIVDFVNNITVLKDHERTQRSEKSFFSRLYNGFTGQEWQRQYEVNSSLIVIAQSQLKMLNDLNNKVTLGLKAIDCVTGRLNHLSQDVADLADFSVETREMLESLTSQVCGRFRELENRLARVELETSAYSQVDHVFNKWAAGRFVHLPVGTRAYAALEELNWGPYGDLVRAAEKHQVNKMLEDLSNRLVIQMREDTDLSLETRVNFNVWLNPVSAKTAEYLSATEYMASDYHEANLPFSCSVARRSQILPLAVPRICSAERLSDALVEEVLGKCA
ncbi:hypothetical protein VCSRO84_2819 [Vibrio cholerae]|uniref:diguanylate cyclase regulator RdcB family protein n=1 Tax=Vibrio cholerae TaxID=666 RepID=UPI0011D44EB3|nr:diguanylate cyclase regulator RdcB family protein [Vibrio cholerae]TXZ23640.1 hypothetical protein FXE70_06590 [Vibrio cholerae]GIA18960.1 hypothetical protein VCSRO84_2819 [Vibrio cholerae]